MANNGRKRQSQPTSSSKNKILRTESPSFEEEVNALLLASDQSDSEGNIEEFLVSDHEFLQLHESDLDEDLGENIPANYGSNDGIIQDEVRVSSPNEKMANGSFLSRCGLERHECLYTVQYASAQDYRQRRFSEVISPFVSATSNAKTCSLQSITKGVTASAKASSG